MPPNTLGLLFGRSGSGKTTLLQAVAGLAEQSAGSISFSGPLRAQGGGGGGAPHLPPQGLALSAEQRMAAAGLVFQVRCAVLRWALPWRAVLPALGQP